VVDEQGQNTGVCKKCLHKCTSCIEEEKKCLSCAEGYVLEGIKCVSIHQVTFTITMTATMDQFLPIYQDLEKELITVTGAEEDDITITSLTEGSTTIDGKVEVSTKESQDSVSSSFENLKPGDGFMTGYEILSSESNIVNAFPEETTTEE
jgi:hypothetical protein